MSFFGIIVPSKKWNFNNMSADPVPGAGPPPPPPPPPPKRGTSVGRDESLPGNTEKVNSAAFVIASLNLGGRCLKSSVDEPSKPKIDDWTKIPIGIRSKFEELLQQIKAKGFEKLTNENKLPKGPCNYCFRINDTEGLVLKIGGNGPEVIVRPEEFLQGEQGFWKAFSIFQENLSPLQKFLSLANDANKYAEYSDLGKRVVTKDGKEVFATKEEELALKTTERKAGKVAAKDFKEIASARSKEKDELIKNSFFQRHKEIFLALTNGCGAIMNICSAFPDNPFFMMATGLFAFIKGSNFAVYNSTSFHEKKRLDKLGIEKHKILEKLLMGNGFLNGLLVMASGFTLFLAGILFEVGKKCAPIVMTIHTVIGTFIFGYVTANLFATLCGIFSGFRLFKVVCFRKELNAILENKERTPAHRALDYLSKVKEKVELTKADIKGIREKIKAELKKSKTCPELAQKSDAELEQFIDSNEDAKALFDARKVQKTKDKMEELQKLSNGNLIAEIFATKPESSLTKIDELINALKKGDISKLEEANRLIQAIDKATYQNLVCHLVYIGIAVLCLLGNLLLLSVILTACPFAPAIWWTTIALIYLVWDYSKSNLYVTGKIYDHGFLGHGSRKKKTEEILGLTNIIPMPQPQPEAEAVPPEEGTDSPADGEGIPLLQRGG